MSDQSASASSLPLSTPQSQRLAKDQVKSHSRLASLGSLSPWSRSSSQISLSEPFLQRTDNDGRNALELAVIGGHVDATDFILNKVYGYKARDIVTTLEGQTLANLAAFHRHVAIIQLLAGHGFNLGRRNLAGQTPFDIAVDKGNGKVMTQLGYYEGAQPPSTGSANPNGIK